MSLNFGENGKDCITSAHEQKSVFFPVAFFYSVVSEFFFSFLFRRQGMKRQQTIKQMYSRCLLVDIHFSCDEKLYLQHLNTCCG